MIIADTARYRRQAGATATLLACWFFGTPEAMCDPLEAEVGAEPTLVHHGADQVFQYRANCHLAEQCLIVVESESFDVRLSIRNPAGRLETYNSPMRRQGRDTVLLPQAGMYRISVFSNEYSGVPGGHYIHLEELGDASDRAAYRLLSQASRIANGDEEQHAGAQAAIDAALEAASIWRAAGKPELEADAIMSAAMIAYWDAWNWRLCEDLADAASTSYRELSNLSMSATADHLKATAMIERATTTGTEPPVETAEDLFDEALQIMLQASGILDEHGDVFQVAEVKNNLGLTHFYLGDWTGAREYWRAAVADFRQQREWSAELNSLTNLSVVDAETGNVSKATAGFERILNLLPDDRLSAQRANTLNNLGAGRRALGDVDGALEAFSSALEIHVANNDVGGEARSRAGLGETYYTIGEFDLALEFLELALPQAIESDHGRIVEHLYQYLGNIAYFRTEYEKAWELHRQALLAATSLPVQAHVQALLARDLRALDRPREAKEAARRALDAAISTSTERRRAEALLELGAAEIDLGNADAAIDNMEEALSIYRELGLPEHVPEVLHQLSRAERAAGNHEGAENAARAAVDEIEALRGSLADPDLRAFFSSSRSRYYEYLVGLLLSGANQTEARTLQALAISERSRNRATIEVISESSFVIGATDASYLEPRRELHQRLAEARFKQNRLLDAGSGTGPEYQALLMELADVENKLNLIETQLRNAQDTPASSDQPLTLSPEQMQELLDHDTALLQFVLAEPLSWAWLVRRDGIEVFPLDDRKTIEQAARALLESLRVPPSLAGTRSARMEALRRLSNLVLPPELSGVVGNRLVIAADGALHYVPFAALTLPGSSDHSPLIDRFEITMIPSMSVIAARTSDRDDPTRTVALFADPVFQATDPRLSGANPVDVSNAPRNRSMTRRLPQSKELVRLVGTAREAAMIARLIEESQRLMVTGLAANREAVLNAPLGDYRIVHFATHGLVDSRYPALSSLALSQVDASGASIDGFLRLYDIYKLKLNSDLVVLSACETALGREIRGEGLVGLTRGFLFAGTKSMVASLWNVSDEATAVLIARLYESLIDEQMKPAEALRSAQRSLAARGRWRDPYYWAAFVVLGDWR